ncbi:hypothetical protein CEK26_006546 [Fusarium fujikuroi]|uniref:DUF8004 domain-containing protein n=1 Tax=Fusarium fujikuroi TaxID=5127 RepID=A0A5Q3EKY5_FUSFU|nr:hypothetical protein CEK27_006555 [Fusarium fujikuroi]QGI79747.1 hypothetical protein CEK25_006476 [Fusarium fujikuroi]QGI93477.1 hypothetical protein CEK26_006546 [Fusarium fujikuroi]VTT61195.1 unnamed protein product [Fusarium fujikuroi]VTT63886.1 unnamed protein product [Fusarium fujikuroi]
MPSIQVNSRQSSLRFSAFVNGRMDHHPTVKRWDGAARTCTEWDNIRRKQDPELWFRNGNCMVHLHAKGHSQRGPSFKVPFSALLEAQCYPLIQRFLVWEGVQAPNLRELMRWSKKNTTRKIELYIPPPPTTDKTQAFNYHLATRNFFAWVFRRSMVGYSLGNALIGLLHSMHEFRSGVDDNVSDMMEYFDEEGYLDMANQPNHALAILQLAECFQMKDLYIRAFAHCVGMSEYLFENAGFQELSPSTRKLIRKGHLELDYRMTRSSSMLKTFLDDELSEAHLSVSAGARAHLERFRSFLLSFYTTKLGYYPPTADSGNDLFDPAILRIMREDFEALYDLLVDDQYTSSHTMPPTAHGGICTIQLVQSFDFEHGYDILDHPLPLLPDTNGNNSRRMSWFPGRVTLRSDRRVTAHTALINASNLMKPGVAQNDLVRAYRRFEEDSIMSPNKADKQEKVSLVDARKVRWILIYATYQVLRYATDTATDLQEDEINEAHYSLSALTDKLPPWDTPRDLDRILRRQTQYVTSGPTWSLQQDGAADAGEDSFGKIEIKPDIDYFALTHRDRPQTQHDNRKMERRASMPSRPSRSNSFTQALSRSSTIRRSMRMFKSPSTTPPQSITPPSRPTYHEIVVHGYGNGTNDVSIDTDGSDTKTDDTYNTTPESIETNDTESPLDTPPLTEYYVEPAIPKDVKARRERRRDVMSMVARSMSGRVSKRSRPISAIFSDSRYADEVESRRHSMFPQPLRIKTQVEEPYIVNEDADWAAMQTFMESPGEMTEEDDDMMPAWEQYADLGGLTDMR